MGLQVSRSLVAGGAGFIGAHLCRSLLRDDHEVIAADNFYSGSRKAVAELVTDSGFELLRHDITFPLYVEVDQIWNLACPASPVQYQRSPIQVTKSSVIGSINLLGLAKRLKIPILLTSTSEIYGDPQEHPQVESYWGHCNPIGTRSCYDESKRCAETLFTDYRRQHGLDAKIVRLFNTYGPGMDPRDGRVVSSFVFAALRGAPLIVHGKGTQTRSFCYVDDIVSGLKKAMSTTFEGPINLGNPAELSIIELAELVVRVTNSRSEICFAEALPDDPVKRRPSIVRAKQILDWAPTIDLETGLQRTAMWLEKQLNKDESETSP